MTPVVEPVVLPVEPVVLPVEPFVLPVEPVVDPDDPFVPEPLVPLVDPLVPLLPEPLVPPVAPLLAVPPHGSFMQTPGWYPGFSREQAPVIDTNTNPHANEVGLMRARLRTARAGLPHYFDCSVAPFALTLAPMGVVFVAESDYNICPCPSPSRPACTTTIRR
jgi:hypothetical protein